MQLFGQNHGFILTDRFDIFIELKNLEIKIKIIIIFSRTRSRSIKSGFLTDVSKNEIGYDYTPNRGEQLFWSLPSSFTGNKVHNIIDTI